MAEESYFWDAAGGGDAVLMPYDESIVRLWLGALFNANYIGGIPLEFAVLRGIGEELLPTNPSGTTIRVGTGAGFAVGNLYWNDAPILYENLTWYPGLTTYYRIVMRWNTTLKEMRLVLLGPDTTGHPAYVRSYPTYWDFAYLDIDIDTVGALVYTSTYSKTRSTEYKTLKCPVRYGDTGDLNWNVAGSDESFGDFIRIHHTARQQSGTKRWTGVAAPSGSIAITFPIPFSYAPICVVHPMNSLAQIMVSVQTTTTGVTIYWEDEQATNRTSLDFMWIAIGPLVRGNVADT